MSKPLKGPSGGSYAVCHSSESPPHPSHLFLRACPWREGARDTHGTDGMQSGPMACLARSGAMQPAWTVGLLSEGRVRGAPLGLG